MVLVYFYLLRDSKTFRRVFLSEYYYVPLCVFECVCLHVCVYMHMSIFSTFVCVCMCLLICVCVCICVFVSE